MCLILFAWDVHPAYRLVVAANRDEYYARPTAPAAFWPEAPGLLAGRDLAGGGSWFGITRQSRFAALTNYRDQASHRPEAPSRGALVTGFLLGDQPPAAWLTAVARQGAAYNGFGLLCGDLRELWYQSNRGGPPAAVSPGIHGLSNHVLDTPWPKVVRGTAALGQVLQAPAVDPEALFALLADRTSAPDGQLPGTGVSLAWERLLSPLFIDAEGYGTRSSTVLLVGRDGEVFFAERSFAAGAVPGATATFRFRAGS